MLGRAQHTVAHGRRRARPARPPGSTVRRARRAPPRRAGSAARRPRAARSRPRRARRGRRAPATSRAPRRRAPARGAPRPSAAPRRWCSASTYTIAARWVGQTAIRRPLGPRAATRTLRRAGGPDQRSAGRAGLEHVELRERVLQRDRGSHRRLRVVGHHDHRVRPPGSARRRPRASIMRASCWSASASERSCPSGPCLWECQSLSGSESSRKSNRSCSTR